MKFLTHKIKEKHEHESIIFQLVPETEEEQKNIKKFWEMIQNSQFGRRCFTFIEDDRIDIKVAIPQQFIPIKEK